MSSGTSANAAYPQLNNLYPAVDGTSSGSGGGHSRSGSAAGGGAGGGGRPAAGPGSGFPQRPPAPSTAQPQQQSLYGGPGSGSGSYGVSSTSYGLGGSGSNASGSGAGGGEKNMVDMIKDNGNKWQRAYRNLLDRSTPLTVQRWLFTAAVLFVFAGVVVIRQGWYIVCYALAIYLLNLFLAFLQPRFDPSLQADLAAEDVEEGAPGLPGGDKKRQAGGGLSGLLSGFQPDGEEEFRPFIRRLPEFKFWLSATKASIVALLSTITRATDVPVYWPILLVYFFVLFGLTMRRQIQHMIKYKYIPFDMGRKATYKGKK